MVTGSGKVSGFQAYQMKMPGMFNFSTLLHIFPFSLSYLE